MARKQAGLKAQEHVEQDRARAAPNPGLEVTEALKETALQEHIIRMDPSRSQRWRHALILFTGLFVSAVVTQFAIHWYIRHEETLSNLNKSGPEREIRTFRDEVLPRLKVAGYC